MTNYSEYKLRASQTGMLQLFSQTHLILGHISRTTPAFMGLDAGLSELVMGTVVWVVTGRFAI